MSSVFVAIYLLLVLFFFAFDKAGIDGVIPLIRANFNINDAQTAIIQTSSSIAHTATLALIWILGDVFDRRKLYLVSVSLWVIFSLLAIFLGSNSFMIFVAFRCLGSVASSIFAVLTPVILADLFRDRALGIALTCMAASETLSSYAIGIVSSWIVGSDLPWQSVLISSPLLVSIPLLTLFCTKSFRRTERSTHSGSLKRIFSNAFGFLSVKSYVLMTMSLALSMFYVQAYGFWYSSMYLSAWNSFPEGFLGLSYTMVITLNSLMMLLGTALGLPTLLWFAQSWNHGTGPFSGSKENARAYPIFVSIGAALNTVLMTLSVVLIEKSYVAVLIIKFLSGFGSSPSASLNQRMMLMVVPASSRAASVALTKLLVGVVGIPSAQIIGMVTDAMRGDSTLPIDQFHAYQTGLLYSMSTVAASCVLIITVIVYFPADCKAAEQKNNEYEKTVNEKSSLIDATKPRSESVLDTFIKSRTATITSTYFADL